MNSSNNNQAFNSAMSHLQNIEGLPSKSADLHSMPAPVRWFAYIAFGGMAIGGIIAFILALMNN
ncbi:hypothetical protein [Brevibacillus fortis]|uniref:Amino acid transporter n=1 Tax=Brevibacillus fortis TaxID=2126352 RepID=A0A2P7V0G8_9BACL|nr:hypothetical protein [Brevibacillus fortis]PSJ92698.1 hypothetical protein C7R93_19610 [Brevibacillus fortis]